MDSRNRQPTAAHDLARQAESLVRALNGVVHARIHAGDRGIDAIHVTARDDGSAEHMAAHVRSALLAGLATPIIAGRIHVRVDPTADGDTAHAAAHEVTADTTDTNGGGTRPRHRIRLIQDDDLAADDDAAPGAVATATATAAPPDDAPAVRRAAVERPRLVAVDVRRQESGRVVCRVSVAYAARVHRAEAAAMDLPGAAAQAAAQATVRALVDAGIDGLELGGLREVEIAGKDYVLVALRRAQGRRFRDRSGSAPMIGSPERSAAEAAVTAAEALI